MGFAFAFKLQSFRRVSNVNFTTVKLKEVRLSGEFYAFCHDEKCGGGRSAKKRIWGHITTSCIFLRENLGR